MVTTPKEYLAGKYREVVLPSTLPNGEHPVFLIRKPPTRVLIEVLSLLDVNLTPETKPEELEKNFTERIVNTDIKEKLPKLLELLIPACVVEPKISLDPNEEDAIYIDDLDFEDQFKLLDEIWNFAGLSKKAEEQRNL